MPAMKELVKGTDRYRHYINGQWVDSTIKEWIDVENPATQAVIASVPRGGEDDADRALVAARAAQPAWEALPPAARGQLLKDLARLILENRERLARIVVAEQGKPIQEARGEIEGAALYLTYAAEEARRITGDIIPSDMPDEQIWIQRVAHGVVVGLTAWNYPAALMCRKMGPALLAGNTIVIKSHEGTPISALEIAQLSSQLDFPPGVINVVSGTGEGIGAAVPGGDGFTLGRIRGVGINNESHAIAIQTRREVPVLEAGNFTVLHFYGHLSRTERARLHALRRGITLAPIIRHHACLHNRYCLYKRYGL